MMGITTVANVRSYRGSMDRAVYCGRPGPYGNPFGGKYIPRAEAISKFRNWFIADAQADLRAQAVRECTGKILLCWCHPLSCHADVIAEYVNAMWRQSLGPIVKVPDARAES